MRKVALVTGGSRGIGAAVVRRLGADGMDVAVGYVNQQEQAQRAVKELEELGVRAMAVQADVADPAAITEMVGKVASWGGRIDHLVCCAGIECFRSLTDITPDDFDRVFHTNARGPLLTTAAAVKHMPAGSSIVWTGSVAATRAFDRHTLYAGTKAALAVMARQIAGELAPEGIRINVVAPGGTVTDMSAEHAKHHLERALVGVVQTEQLAEIKTATGRWAQPPEIASTIAFLLSDDAAYMTGATLPVDGGFR